MPSREYVAPSWDEIYHMMLDLALTIRRSGFTADLIVGVSRGGWAPARILSDLLENTHTANVKIEFYTGIEKTTRKPVVTQPISENITKKNILLVDDVSDTGESLVVALNHVRDHGAADAKTVTVYYKPHSVFKPDFFAAETPDWIIFPWERLEATKLLIQEARESGRSDDSVRTILQECRFDDKTIASLFELASGGT